MKTEDTKESSVFIYVNLMLSHTLGDALLLAHQPCNVHQLTPAWHYRDKNIGSAQSQKSF